VPLTVRTWSLVSAALYDLCDSYDKSFSEAHSAAYRYHGLDRATPLAGLVELLAAFGAVGGGHGKTVITLLGRWAAAHLTDGLSGPADPALPAAEMIAEYWSDEDPAEPEPFDRADVNRKLAALAERGSSS